MIYMPYLKVVYTNGKLTYPFEKKHKEIKHEERCNLIAWNFLYRIKLREDDTFDIVDTVIDDVNIEEGREYILYYEV